MDLGNLTAFDAQDALRTAISAEAGSIPVDLGFPTSLQKEHIWIAGDTDTALDFAETDDSPTSESFTVRVYMLTTRSGDDASFVMARDRLRELVAFLTAALVSDDFTSVVSQARLESVSVNEGRSGDGHPQAAATIDISCRLW